jgi:predicted Rossmann fold flavoprotein
MMAAGQAAAAGARVLLLEKMRRPGRKLAITGKGRCNLTNQAELRAFLTHFHPDGRFLRQAFHRFFVAELLDFLAEVGIDTVLERGGRIFPTSGRAPEVVAAFERWLIAQGVRVVTDQAINRIVATDGRVQGVQVGRELRAAGKVILATGGASYPRTGSTGDGYQMARALGHRVVPIRPALVPLVVGEKWVGAMAGLQLRNVAVRLEVDGRSVARTFGELAFTEDGVGGPVCLTLSSQVVDHLQQGRQVVLVIDCKPALDDGKLDGRLVRDLADRCHEPMRDLLRGLVPREMVNPALAASGIDAETKGGEVRAQDRKRLRLWLKGIRLTVTGHRPMAEALVTAGGVALDEVDPRTLGSRLVDGLYFAGEILDIQADTGGYNLQAAFSTGWLAGRSAAGAVAR